MLTFLSVKTPTFLAFRFARSLKIKIDKDFLVKILNKKLDFYLQ